MNYLWCHRYFSQIWKLTMCTLRFFCRWRCSRPNVVLHCLHKYDMLIGNVRTRKNWLLVFGVRSVRFFGFGRLLRRRGRRRLFGGPFSFRREHFRSRGLDSGGVAEGGVLDFRFRFGEEAHRRDGAREEAGLEGSGNVRTSGRDGVVDAYLKREQQVQVVDGGRPRLKGRQSCRDGRRGDHYSGRHHRDGSLVRCNQQTGRVESGKGFRALRSADSPKPVRAIGMTASGNTTSGPPGDLAAPASICRPADTDGPWSARPNTFTPFIFPKNRKGIPIRINCPVMHSRKVSSENCGYARASRKQVHWKGILGTLMGLAYFVPAEGLLEELRMLDRVAASVHGVVSGNDLSPRLFNGKDSPPLFRQFRPGLKPRTKQFPGTGIKPAEIAWKT